MCVYIYIYCITHTVYTLLSIKIIDGKNIDAKNHKKYSSEIEKKQVIVSKKIVF